jgi:hypothetical protein
MALAGWLLIVARLLFMVVQAIWPRTFMGTSRSFDGEGFRFSTNWPGFELIAFGAILLVIGAAQGQRHSSLVSESHQSGGVAEIRSALHRSYRPEYICLFYSPLFLPQRLPHPTALVAARFPP